LVPGGFGDCQIAQASLWRANRSNNGAADPAAAKRRHARNFCPAESGLKRLEQAPRNERASANQI
ncbi:MAG: hypothetical protein WA661_16400, partial [Xanthobacteraceae bacterium]